MSNQKAEIETKKASQSTLTAEQRQAVETMGKNLLVSASAGSGKTMVMIKRIAEMIISKKASVADMLVVTFTKAAASEMKLKLIDELNKIEPKTDYIRNELMEVNIANISTLHSFCARLLKTYFYVIGLDPSFVLIDEIESLSLKNKAMEKLIYDNFMAGNKDFLEILDIFSLKRSDENFREIIFQLAEFLTTQIDVENWIKETTANAYDQDLNKNICANYLNEYVSKKAKNILERVEILKQKIHSCGCKELVAYLDDCTERLRGVRPENNYLKNRQILSLAEAYPRIPRVDESFSDLKAEASEMKDFIKKQCDKLVDILEFDNSKASLDKLKQGQRRVEILWQMTFDFVRNYTDLKKEKVALDFSDLEKYTLELFKNKEICKSIQERFKYIFVDEYQDINMVQEEILKNVSSGDNLFMVGDVKQSIYGFRASEPQIFIDKMDLYTRSTRKNKSIRLNHNFRSHQDILSFVNEVFARAMTKEFGNIDYKVESMFQKGDLPYPSVSEQPIVSMNVIVSPQTKQEEMMEDLPVYSVKNHKNKETQSVKNAIAEGRAVVDSIKKFIGTEIYIAGKEPTTKRVDYSDFAILTASRNEYLVHILNELEAAEIPYSTDIETDIFEEPILNVLKCFLQIIENKNQDIPLLSVMQSKLFDFTVDELADIRRADRESRYYYMAVKNATKSQDIPQKLRKKCVALYDKINEFSFKSKVLPVDQLINEIIKDFEFNYIVANEENGAKVLTNLNKLISYLPAKSYNLSLAKFLEYINENPIKFEVESAENSVKVTTIHKSKGLQYPIVILVGCGRELLRKNGTDLIISKKMGIASSSYNIEEKTKGKNIVKIACQIEKDSKELEEKARLLYVALTRPINHLVMIGTRKEKDYDKTPSPDSASSFFDWLLPVLSAKKNNEMLNNEISFEGVVRSLNSYYIELPEEKNKKFVFGKTDEKVSLKTEKVFDYVYPYKNLTDMPTKTTVSEIIHDNENVENIAHFYSYGSRNGLEIGVAYHKVLQNFDFSKSGEKFDSEFERVMKQMNERESGFIQKTEIQKFIENPFTKELAKGRMLKEQEFIALTKLDNGSKKKNDNDGVIVQGVVDLIVETKNGLIVVDYKTNKWKKEENFIEVYKKQVEIYSKVVEESYGKKVVGKYIYAFSLSKYIDVK